MTRHRWILVLIFTLALLVRLACTGWVLPAGHFMKYPALLEEIARGDTQRAADGSFVYLTWHRVFKGLFDGDLRWALYAQLILGAASAALIALVGKRVFSPAVGYLAGTGAAVSAGLLVYDRVFEPESLLLFLTLSWVACWISWRERPTAILAGLAAGLLLGCAVATRPTLAPLLPAVLLLMPGSRKLRIASLALTALPLLLVVLHNHAYAGRWSFSTMNPGTVFFEGHNADACGALSAYPLVLKDLELQHPGRADFSHVLYRQLSAASLGASEPTVEASNRYWYGKAASFIKEYPSAEVLLIARKLRILFSGWEPHDIDQAALAHDALAPLPLLRWPLVIAFALPGLVLAVRLPRSPALWLVIGIPACFALANVSFYVSARQKIHILPWMLLLAGYGITEGWRLWAEGRRRVCALGAVAVIVIAAASARMPSAAADLQRLRQAAALSGRAYRAALGTSDADAKTGYALHAVAASPWAADKLRPRGARYDETFAWRLVEISRSAAVTSAPDQWAAVRTALCAMQAGRFAEALPLLEESRRSGRFPYLYYLAPSTADYYIGICRERLGHLERALVSYDQALATQPGNAWVLGRKADLLRRLRRTAMAAAAESLLRRLWDPVTAGMALGVAAWEARDFEESRKQFGAVILLAPDYLKPRVYYAASLARLGRRDEADREYARALAVNSTLAFPEADFPPALERERTASR